MKKTATLYILFAISFLNFAYADSIDSLKQKLQVTTIDSAKADIYTRLAGCYMNFDSAPNRYTKRIYSENAINYTMLALHLYSKISDTTGLRNSYSDLAKAYRSQNKFAQAKWFVLQANYLARQQKDTKYIISTLVDLAGIKMDIKDYNLAKKDLKEALRLTVLNNLLEQDTKIKPAFTRLYASTKVADDENIFINNNLLKASAYPTVTLAKPAVKKSKSPTSKKKFYSVSNTQITAEPAIVSL
ncbi:hypothetical protein KHS38_01430 [Mucilaginibacter sp. Bleaf8]|uniref:hypothetical protein n=1 Tax=Mucilaginibacter sp. Bleaf8 TaxID=2834430 RepID=UPI001BCC691C|nr:hypothetical protein [Mucilaginibacter sp. Bleaf8]MBS7563052.1 hypothetical protein [Mucilaginibacter sp. Bleaf8]